MHTLIRVLMVLVFLEAMADVWTTNKALKLPGVTEANPVMAFVQRLVGSWWVLVRLAMALVVITMAVRAGDVWQAPLMLGANFLLMVWVIWNNLKLIRSNSVNSV